MASKGGVPGNSPVNAAMELARQHHERGELERATQLCQQVLALQPNNGDALCLLGVLLFQTGDTRQSIDLLRRATHTRPMRASFFYNLGKVHHTLGDLPDAMAAYRRAIDIDPRQPQAYCNLANALQLRGEIHEALKLFERAMLACPASAILRTMYLCALNYVPNPDRRAIFLEHAKFDSMCPGPPRKKSSGAKPPVPGVDVAAPAESRSPQSTTRRLRVGYVSPDFRQHSVAHFIEPVMRAHDKGRFEVFGYSNTLRADEMTDLIQSHCDHWRLIANQSDESAARIIRNDGIDLLVDLAGHTPENRLKVFALRPAPVQATWLGYPNTTGMSAMDYRITDSFADPIGESDLFHTEKLVRLPECFSCFQAPLESPEVGPLPALANGHITFGSFNNALKINSNVIALWSEILRRVPRSRLMLKYEGMDSSFMASMLREAFLKLDVSPDRLDILGKDQSRRQHMERYNQVDIGLDPFPYNGTTTTCDAMWMGVPVVTLEGTSHVGRVGVSQMRNIGLPELIARDVDDYARVAASLAENVEKLAALRAGLRGRMTHSPLVQIDRFTRHLEAAYERMWRDHMDAAAK